MGNQGGNAGNQGGNTGNGGGNAGNQGGSAGNQGGNVGNRVRMWVIKVGTRGIEWNRNRKKRKKYL